MSEYCKAQVWEGWHYGRCAKKASRDGWCGTHHPDAVEKRKAKRDAASAARQAKWDADAKRYAWERKAIEACAGMSDPEARIAALRACEQEQGQFLVEMVRERDALRAERDALKAECDDLLAVKHWNEGYPPHPYDKEWFIAITTYGDRVVLRALPEEYTYDFTTADQTYLKKEGIAKWMQFPDTEFKTFDSAALARSAN